MANLVQFLGALFVARQFGPELFGYFSFFTSVAQTISLFVDFGLMGTLVRVAGRKPAKSDKQSTIASTLIVQLFLYLSFCVTLYVAKPYLLEASGIPLRYHSMYELALLTACGLWLQLLLKSVLQVFNQIASIGVFTLTYALARIVFILYAWVYWSSDLESFYLALYLYPLAVSLFIFLLIQSPKITLLIRLNASSCMRDTKELLSYGKWMLGHPFYSFMFLLPLLLLSSNSASEVGIYSAAYTVASVFTLLNTTLRQINMPKASAFSTQAEIDDYVKAIWSKAPLYFLFFVASTVVLGVAMYWGLGPEFKESIPAFCVLSMGMAVMVFLGQINIVAHVHNRPDFFLKLTIGEFMVLSLCCYVAIVLCGAGALAASSILAATIGVGEIALYRRVVLLNRIGLS